MEIDLYKIIKPVSSEAVGNWIKSYPNYRDIIGYSNLGHIFLFSPHNSDYAIFYPYKSAAKSYGSFDSVIEFERQVLLEPGFLEYVLKPDHVKEIRRRLGSLNADEVYIAQPYPFLGGDESVDSYGKGNIWVMLDLVAQMLEDDT